MRTGWELFRLPSLRADLHLERYAPAHARSLPHARSEPAAAEWVLILPPVRLDLLQVILGGRQTPKGTEPTDVEWEALETLEAMVATGTMQGMAQQFTNAVIRADAPEAEWSRDAPAPTWHECETIRREIAINPLPQYTIALTELRKARARLGRCVPR